MDDDENPNPIEYGNREDLQKPTISCREAGRRGGNKVKEKYGTEYYQRIGKVGGQRTMQKHGPDFYTEMGKKGGQSRKQTPDKDVLDA